MKLWCCSLFAPLFLTYIKISNQKVDRDATMFFRISDFASFLASLNADIVAEPTFMTKKVYFIRRSS